MLYKIHQDKVTINIVPINSPSDLIHPQPIIHKIRKLTTMMDRLLPIIKKIKMIKGCSLNLWKKQGYRGTTKTSSQYSCASSDISPADLCSSPLTFSIKIPMTALNPLATSTCKVKIAGITFVLWILIAGCSMCLLLQSWRWAINLETTDVTTKNSR